MSSGLLSNQFIDTTSRDPFVPWTRPADWLTLTDPTVGQEKIVILAAVFEGNSNYLAFNLTGAYTVDWGDGAGTVNFASGVKASKQLLWSSYSSGTLTTRGYRQAIITITPQSGQTITTADFTVAHSPPPAATYSTTFLDFVMSAPSLTSFTLGGNGPLQGHRILERARLVGSNSVTDWSFRFGSLPSLRTCAATNGQGYDLWTSSATAMNGMFNACGALEACPTFSSTSANTQCGSMFANCGNMRSVPLFNTASVITAGLMFTGCSALTTLPAFDWSSLTTANSMLSGCSALSTIPWTVSPVLSTANLMFQNVSALSAIPAMDWSKVTTLNTTFSGCASLVDTSALGHATKGISSLCTDMTSTFTSCKSLTSVASMNTSGVTTLSGCFNGCPALTTLPTPSGNNWKTSAVTTFLNMFQTCTSLQTIPLLDTSAATTLGNMFNGCAALTSVPALNVANCTNFAQMFLGCSSLQSAPIAGGRFAISYLNCMLGAAALDAIYTALGTASGSQTITVTGNYGTTGDTPSIATGKGWTVTGS